MLLEFHFSPTRVRWVGGSVVVSQKAGHGQEWNFFHVLPCFCSHIPRTTQCSHHIPLYITSGCITCAQKDMARNGISSPAQITHLHHVKPVGEIVSYNQRAAAINSHLFTLSRFIPNTLSLHWRLQRCPLGLYLRQLGSSWLPNQMISLILILI